MRLPSIIFSILILAAFGSKGQGKGKFYFELIVLDSNDSVIPNPNFYFTVNNKIVMPKPFSNLSKFSFLDSTIDFHLQTLNKHYIFKGIETYRLLRNQTWKLKPNKEAGETSYEIFVDRLGCALNVIVDGKNNICINCQNFHTNHIQLITYTNRKEFLKKRLVK